MSCPAAVLGSASPLHLARTSKPAGQAEESLIVSLLLATLPGYAANGFLGGQRFSPHIRAYNYNGL
jgi:hypothetical protein